MPRWCHNEMKHHIDDSKREKEAPLMKMKNIKRYIEGNRGNQSAEV